jgi:site-specific recombinase XerD
MNKELIQISDQELISRLQEYGTDAEGAFSENTMMALRRDLAKFAAWCQQQNRSPLPATDETVRNYIYWCAEKYKPASIERSLASIAHLHRAAEQEDPTKRNRVKLALKTVKSGKQAPFPRPTPIRTQHESFPSLRSSSLKANFS